jgi:membrane protease YdiL (CAAX protease family)
METQHAYKAVSYFAATFFVTFSLWFLGANFSHTAPDHTFYMPIMLLGLATPFVLSLLFLYKFHEKEAMRDFIDRIVNIKRAHLAMLPTFLIVPFSVIISIGLSLLVGGGVDQFALAEAFSFDAFVPVLLLLVLAATFEELGWRGYAFDALQAKLPMLWASLAFGVLWSFWHFPLVFVKDSYQYQLFQENVWFGINFFVSIIPMGVIISWVCVKNNKSIAIAILYHLVINLSQEVLQIEQSTKCIQTGVLSIMVACILYKDKKFFLR